MSSDPPATTPSSSSATSSLRPPWLEALLFKINPHVVYGTDDPVYLKPSFTPNTIFQRLRPHYDKVAHVVRRARWTGVYRGHRPLGPPAQPQRRRRLHGPQHAPVRHRPSQRPPHPHRQGASSAGAAPAAAVQYLGFPRPRPPPSRRDPPHQSPSHLTRRLGRSPPPSVPSTPAPGPPTPSYAEMAEFDIGLGPSTTSSSSAKSSPPRPSNTWPSASPSSPARSASSAK